MKLPTTRWHAAGALLQVLPEVRGKDRIVSLVRGVGAPRSLAAAPTVVRFGPGLTATLDIERDGSFADMFFLQFRKPALAPVLEAVLQPGAVFFDVGANVGVYSLWASRLVGDSGHVYAFEPVPDTAAWLRTLVAENHTDNVTVMAAAASDSTGTLSIMTVSRASGLSHVVRDRDQCADDTAALSVRCMRLDDIESTPPSLVKIDVEGFEDCVVAGMAELLDSAVPAVVFEAPDFGGGAGTVDVVHALGEHGYGVWSLTPKGLRPFVDGRYSHNLLALHPARHEAVGARLAEARFPRSQNC